jgi:hypothetical protein
VCGVEGVLAVDFRSFERGLGNDGFVESGALGFDESGALGFAFIEGRAPLGIETAFAAATN